ncbi:hypothetical protein [Lichenicoccus sp.]|uniref:hypothetical protein n=1 Tax=Lichenicoccus sp. TaxID=2781899 RepID=UPI003D0ACE58
MQSTTRKRALRWLAALAFLLGGSIIAQARDLRGHWIGTLHTLQGTCPNTRSSTLVIDGHHLSFAPADGVLILQGMRVPGQTRLHAQLELPGANHKPFPMVFEGHPQGHAIVGLYGTPACRAEIQLRRPGG